MAKLSPLQPIFHPDISYGAFAPGSTPGTEPPPVTVSSSVVTLPVSVPNPSIPTNVTAAAITLPVSVPAPTATTPVFSIVGSVTDSLLDGVVNVIVDGDYCYLISPAQDRMTVVDVSNPASPSVVGSYTSSTNIDSPRRIAKSGNYVYVTSETGDSLASIDVSTPSSPAFGSKATNATTLDGAYGVAISGNYAFVAAGGSSGRRLTTVDISNPASLSVVGNTGSADLTNFGSARGVAVSGNYAYVCSFSGNRVTVVDVSTPTSPSTVTSAADATKLDGASYVIKDGNYLYVAAQDLGYMTIIDVTTPSSPVIKDGEQYGERGICKIGDYVFTSNGGQEVDALYVSNINDIRFLDFIDDAQLSGVNDLATDGTYIYAACATADRLTILQYA